MYIFRPPTTPIPMGNADDHLFGRVTYGRGNAVLKTNAGAYVQVSVYDPDTPDIAAFYLGGHENLVSDAEAALLTTAGYGAYLQAI